MTPKENEESLVLALICAYERIGSSFFFLEVALEISPAVEALRGTINPSPFAPAPFICIVQRNGKYLAASFSSSDRAPYIYRTNGRIFLWK